MQPISIHYQSIGVFRTTYSAATGAPRQGILMPEGRGTIELLPAYHDALKDLELFEYIIVLYHLNQIKQWEPHVSPPTAEHSHHFGLFATRSPKRPNPIGLAIVKLEGICEGVLQVSGVDAFDGTPILDIKPYLPSIDRVDSQQNEVVEKKLGHHDEQFISDPSFYL